MKERYEHFDMFRGIAVLLVCLGHLRAFLFVDYSSILDPKLALKIFYGFTSLGNQAIIFLFVLSGYLVGGEVASKIFLGQWSFLNYFGRRLSRLWIVMIPSLILTYILDKFGIFVGGKAGYEGVWNHIYSTGPSIESPANHLFQTFLGNVAFLQTIYVPAFGSNLALWFIANQFWYYLLFPLVLFALISGGNNIIRFFATLFALAMVWMLPMNVVLLGSIWVMGAAAYFAQKYVSESRSFPFRIIALIIVLSLVIYAIPINHENRILWADIFLGFCFALSLPILADLPSFGSLYRIIASGLSKISFTLFVVHFPFITMIVFTMIAPNQWPVNMASISLFVSLFALTMLFSGIVWWCFERHTNNIQIIIQKTIKRLSSNII